MHTNNIHFYIYVVGTNLNCIDKLMHFKWVPTTYTYIYIYIYIVGTHLNCIDKLMHFKWIPTTYTFIYIYIQSTLVISNFTGPDKNVRVISSSRQPNCDVIGMTTVRLCSPKRGWKAHVYGNLNNLRVLQFALLLLLFAMVLLE